MNRKFKDEWLPVPEETLEPDLFYFTHMSVHICVCVWALCVEARGQLCEVNSLLPIYKGGRDQTQVTRLAQQVPLTTEPSGRPYSCILIPDYIISRSSLMFYF